MIALGCDHGGYKLKEAIIKYLEDKHITYKDFGTYSKESVDFPKYATLVSESVKTQECESGILCCGTGVGMSIAANKVPGIRAAVVGDCFTAKVTKEHNNANIICIGERVTGESLALMIVETWLNAKFENGRHNIRLKQVDDIERKYNK